MHLSDLALRAAPYLVITFETTGLDPDDDRVVELAAVALDPDEPPRRVVDTLVDPQRPMAGTRFHGLTEADVEGAPQMAEVWPALAEAAAGRVLAFYDGRFGFGFLETEAYLVGRSLVAPYVDVMRLPRAGGFGPADWPLWRAGQRYGVGRRGETRAAGEDALLTAAVLRGHLDALAEGGVVTFADLAKRAAGDAFVRSFGLSPMVAPRGVEAFEPRPRAARKASA